MWKGSLIKCWKKLAGGVGIFCGNFCTRRGKLLTCKTMWCRGCYKERDNDDFHKGEKPSGGDYEEEAQRRYERGRSGYHLLTHFQCDKCQFGKIHGRYPDSLAEKDMRSMVLVRRATLDVF